MLTNTRSRYDLKPFNFHSQEPSLVKDKILTLVFGAILCKMRSSIDVSVGILGETLETGQASHMSRVVVKKMLL